MSFIDDYIETFSQTESPESFFRWSAIAAVSAILRKRVFINKKAYRLYPNLYVMLVAKSGLRKGYPVKQAQKLVEELEVMKVISGRSSIQSIITELSRQWTTESGKVLTKAQAFIVNDELDSLLVGDPQAQTILTALYDSFYHKDWKNTLKKDGKELLRDLYITMLTATNPEHLDHFLEKASIKGGFIGRTILVYEEKKSKINPLIEIGNADPIEVDTKPLLEQLKAITDLDGRMTLDNAAAKYYIDWYMDFHQKLESGELEDETGTAERAGDTVLKLAGILCVARHEMNILTDDMENAKVLFYESVGSMRRVTAGSGKSEIADKVKSVLGYLSSKPEYGAYKKQILAARYGDIDSNDLARVIDTLDQAGIIECTIDPKKGPFYKITEKYSKKLKDKFGV